MLGAYNSPRLSPQAVVIHQAAIYEELERQEGWKDFRTKLQAFQDQLAKDLEYGKFGSQRDIGVTDNEVRAMLFLCRRLIAIPAEAKFAYERWREVEEEMSKYTHSK